MSAASELDKIAREVAVCTKCELCRTRTNTVPGEGSPNARVLFIGEAPGFQEDQQGRPFVGPSGQLLNKLLSAINLPREEVFIANVIKCRPPQNLDPTPEQMAACKPYLDRQIAAINPRLIITLGRFSMARYWPGQRISQVHGQPRQADGRFYLPMFHPAAALRDRDRTLSMFKEDGFKIPALLEKAEELARNEIWGYPVQDEPEVATPLTVADEPVSFNPALIPAVTRQDNPATNMAPVKATLQAENQADLLTGKETGPVTTAPVPVSIKFKETKAETAGEIPPTLEAEVVPGLALSEVAQDGSARQGHGKPASKPRGEQARPRKKRPAAPGEQLTMF